MNRLLQMKKGPLARAFVSYFAFINALVMSSMRFEKPHSLSYHENTLTSVPPMTRVSEGTLVKVCSWYDNEWGFSNRMLDTTIAWSKAS